MTKSIDVFSSLNLGAMNLPNRIVMAPMTRNRAGPGEVPSLLAVTYYTPVSYTHLTLPTILRV